MKRFFAVEENAWYLGEQFTRIHHNLTLKDLEGMTFWLDGYYSTYGPKPADELPVGLVFCGSTYDYLIRLEDAL